MRGIMTDDRKKLEGRYHRLYQGMVEKDRAILEEVLSPAFVLVHMTGMRQTKEAFIRAVENGTLSYDSAKHQDIAVQIQGDRVSLTGKSLVHASVFGGGWHTWRLRLDCQLVRNNGIWCFTEARASTY